LKKVFTVANPIVLAVFGCVGIARAQSEGQPRVLKLPPTWVAFSSDVTIVQPDGQEQRGRFYRGSDGSERLEITSGPMIYTTIKNISQRTFYRFQGPTRVRPAADHWPAQPMLLPPEGWLPIPEIVESAKTMRQREPVDGVTA
jgi:hypothetical protein